MSFSFYVMFLMTSKWMIRCLQDSDKRLLWWNVSASTSIQGSLPQHPDHTDLPWASSSVFLEGLRNFEGMYPVMFDILCSDKIQDCVDMRLTIRPQDFTFLKGISVTWMQEQRLCSLCLPQPFKARCSSNCLLSVIPSKKIVAGKHLILYVFIYGFSLLYNWNLQLATHFSFLILILK